MNQSEQIHFPVEKPSQTLPGPYTSPPPIGYPTRDAVVGDHPAVAVETKSKGDCDQFWTGCCKAIFCGCVWKACCG